VVGDIEKGVIAMGLSTKKTKSTTNQNTTANITPTNPDFVTNSISGLTGRINDTFAGLDPQSLVPNADPLQLRAAAGAAGLGSFPGYGGGGGTAGTSPLAPDVGGGAVKGDGSRGTIIGYGPTDLPIYSNDPSVGGGLTPGVGPPGTSLNTPRVDPGVTSGMKAGIAGTSPMEPGAPGSAASTGDPFTDAMNALKGVSDAGPSHVDRVSIADSIPGFMNPYLKDVVDTSLSDFDFGAGQQMGQAKLDLAQDTTYGGSGGALFKRGLASDTMRGRGTLAAGLRTGAYDRASALAAQQAGLDTGRNLTNAGLMEQALNRRAGAATGLAGVGATAGGEGRANIDAQATIGDILRQIQAGKAGAPITALGANADILGKLPFDLFRGSNATGSLSGTTTGKESGISPGDLLGFFAANAKAAAAGAGGG
jgi:hypothetical protein